MYPLVSVHDLAVPSELLESCARRESAARTRGELVRKRRLEREEVRLEKADSNDLARFARRRAVAALHFLGALARVADKLEDS